MAGEVHDGVTLRICWLGTTGGSECTLAVLPFRYQPDDRIQMAGAYRAGEALTDRSRRPATSPGRCAPGREAPVMALRAQHPAW